MNMSFDLGVYDFVSRSSFGYIILFLNNSAVLFRYIQSAPKFYAQPVLFGPLFPHINATTLDHPSEPPNVWLIYRIFKHIYTILIWLLSISIYDGVTKSPKNSYSVLSQHASTHTSRINNFAEWIAEFTLAPKPSLLRTPCR